MKKNLKLIVFTVVLCAVSALNVKSGVGHRALQ